MLKFIRGAKHRLFKMIALYTISLALDVEVFFFAFSDGWIDFHSKRSWGRLFFIWVGIGTIAL